MSVNHRGKKTTSPFNWKCGELKRLLSRHTANDRIILIASDVIYDEDLTEAFFRTLESLMSSSQRVKLDVTSSESNNSNNRHANNLTAGRMKRNAEDQETPSKFGTPVEAFHHEIGNKGAEVFPTEVSPILYLALEKRFNFTIEDMSVVATGYRALQRNVLDVTDGPLTMSLCRQGYVRSFKFEGMRIALTFQQCFRYPRDENMEIWRIKLRT